MNKQKISINNNALTLSKIIEVRGDVIVPDVKPDIVSIINSSGNSYIYKKEVTTSRVRVDGNIDVYTIYLSDAGETRSISTTLNFVETLEDSEIQENMDFDYKLNLLNIDAKMLNERKISLYAKLEIIGTFKKNTEIEIIDDISEMKNVEKLEENKTIKSFIGKGIGKASVKENIVIVENDELSEIVKVNTNIANLESKISFNKVLAKAEMEIKIVYLTEDDRVNTASGTFPVMSFIDMENVKEEYNCSIDYKIKNMTISPNAKEQHSISVFVEFESQCEVFQNKDIKIIRDLYGTKSNINCKKNLICIDSCTKDEDKINISDKIFIEDINKVVDIECFPAINQKNESNNIINYEGEVLVKIIYEADNKRGLSMQQVKIPFVYKKESLSQIEFIISKKEFSLVNEDVNIDLEIKVCENNKTTERLEIIEDITEEETDYEDIYSMIVYFVKPEDTLWNIGKKFKVSANNICKYNDINDSKIAVGDKLYIIR